MLVCQRAIRSEVLHATSLRPQKRVFVFELSVRHQGEKQQNRQALQASRRSFHYFSWAVDEKSGLGPFR
jgi:hypothetical protein